jgi:hypothetical protein
MENIPDMEADILFCYLVEFRDECLREPDGPFFEPDFNAARPVFGLVKENLGMGYWFRNRVIAQSFTTIAPLLT